MTSASPMTIEYWIALQLIGGGYIQSNEVAVTYNAVGGSGGGGSGSNGGSGGGNPNPPTLAERIAAASRAFNEAAGEGRTTSYLSQASTRNRSVISAYTNGTLNQTVFMRLSAAFSSTTYAKRAMTSPSNTFGPRIGVLQARTGLGPNQLQSGPVKMGDVLQGLVIVANFIPVAGEIIDGIDGIFLAYRGIRLAVAAGEILSATKDDAGEIIRVRRM